MNDTGRMVSIVDDDEAIRDSLMLLLRAEEIAAQSFASAEQFLDAFDPARHGCLIVDVRMPRMTGLELLTRLRKSGSPLPVILITGHGDIPMAVAALKAGATDFFEKPFDDTLLLASVREALNVDDARRRHQFALGDLARRRAELTPREREVMDQLVEGHPNKVIGARFGISPRTVEVHRARIMEKMQARNLSDLVRMALRLSSGDETPRT
jgi:two-component system, LuxR family, response regulator FixJ